MKTKSHPSPHTILNRQRQLHNCMHSLNHRSKIATCCRHCESHQSKMYRSECNLACIQCMVSRGATFPENSGPQNLERGHVVHFREKSNLLEAKLTHSTLKLVVHVRYSLELHRIRYGVERISCHIRQLRGKLHFMHAAHLHECHLGQRKDQIA